MEKNPLCDQPGGHGGPTLSSPLIIVGGHKGALMMVDWENIFNDGLNLWISYSEKRRGENSRRGQHELLELRL